MRQITKTKVAMWLQRYWFKRFYPIPQPQEGCDTKSIFERNSTGLNSLFLLFDWLSNQDQRTKSILQLLPAMEIVGGSSCIHTFPKDISAMWNANSHVLDLKSGHWVHFYSYDHNTTTAFLWCVSTYVSSDNVFNTWNLVVKPTWRAEFFFSKIGCLTEAKEPNLP